MAILKGEIKFVAACCRAVPCAHPGVGPCDMPAKGAAKVDELQLEQLRAEHIGEIRPLDTLADAQRTVPGVNS